MIALMILSCKILSFTGFDPQNKLLVTRCFELVSTVEFQKSLKLIEGFFLGFDLFELFQVLFEFYLIDTKLWFSMHKIKGINSWNCFRFLNFLLNLFLFSFITTCSNKLKLYLATISKRGFWIFFECKLWFI